MPAVIRRRGPFRLLRCLFAPVREDGSVPAIDVEAAFLDRFLAYVRRDRPCHRIGQPENWALFRSAPAGSVSAPFGSYRVPLRGRTIEDVVAGFKPRYRRYVREGVAAGAVLRTGPGALDGFYAVHSTTMERAGLWLAPRSRFDDLLAAFGPVADVGVVEVDGVPAAGELVMTTRFGTFALYGGTSREAPNYAGKLLQAEMMKRSIDRGAEFYDFVGARLSDVGGTSVAGIQQFKSGFGAELVEGVLWKADIDRVRSTALDALRRLRGNAGGDIIDQERSTT
jgi:lipid II:glycine glycyltransferase (peptidoglycan interpeptide bridge formation enzyme)